MPAACFDSEFVASAESSLGLLYLRQREVGSLPGGRALELYLDHALLMSSASTASEQALARRALELHRGRGLSVLVGGLGLGYTARAVLASLAVAELEVIELLPELIGWFDAGLIPLAAELRADPRFRLRQGDVYAHLVGPAGARFDLILIDVDHAPEERLGEGNAAFYAAPALRRASLHLAPAGILGVWSYAPSPRFEAELRRVFGEVEVEPLTSRNPALGEDETHWLHLARR
jgi:spermidine synthase